MHCPYCGAQLDPDDIDQMLDDEETADDRRRRWQVVTDAEALREAQHPSAKRHDDL